MPAANSGARLPFKGQAKAKPSPEEVAWSRGNASRTRNNACVIAKHTGSALLSGSCVSHSWHGQLLPQALAMFPIRCNSKSMAAVAHQAGSRTIWVMVEQSKALSVEFSCITSSAFKNLSWSHTIRKAACSHNIFGSVLTMVPIATSQPALCKTETSQPALHEVCF